MGIALYGTRENKIYQVPHRLIRCSKCGRSTIDSFSYRVSDYGDAPVIFACWDCGGRPRTSEEAKIGKMMDYLNRWSIVPEKQWREKARKDAIENNEANKRDGRKTQFPVDQRLGSNLDNDTRSRLGEICAKLVIKRELKVDLFLHRYNYNFYGPDLGDFYQIRTQLTSKVSDQGLIVRKKQPHEDDVYVYVTTNDTVFVLHGWRIARDIMIPEFYRSPGFKPFWQMPVDRLYPMHKLPITNDDYEKALRQTKVGANSVC